MNNEPVAWNYNDNNLEPNTITFNNVNSDWVMQITADRKIIVNEDVDVSEAAQAVLDAVQNLLLVPHPVKELTETDLILILEVLIDSYDDTNRGFLEYQAMYKNSPMRKARIDGMKRMVDKHTHAIEMVEAILRKAQEK